MLSPLDFLSDLTNPLLSFLPKALLVAVVCSVVAGVIGSHVVLRGMAFIGNAVAHSVFPGLAVAFLMQGSLLLGGSIAGLTTAILVAVVSQNRRLKEDSVIGILFVGPSRWASSSSRGRRGIPGRCNSSSSGQLPVLPTTTSSWCASPGRLC